MRSLAGHSKSNLSRTGLKKIHVAGIPCHPEAVARTLLEAEATYRRCLAGPSSSPEQLLAQAELTGSSGLPGGQTVSSTSWDIRVVSPTAPSCCASTRLAETATRCDHLGKATIPQSHRHLRQLHEQVCKFRPTPPLRVGRTCCNVISEYLRTDDPGRRSPASRCTLYRRTHSVVAGLLPGTSPDISITKVEGGDHRR